MSLTRANGAPNLLSLPAEIRCKILFMLFQHAFMWLPHKLPLYCKPGTMDNEIANLTSVIYTCKTLNIEATPCLAANIMVNLDTDRRYFETLHYRFRQDVVSNIRRLSLANPSYIKRPRDLQMVLDAATSLRTLALGPFPSLAIKNKDSQVFLKYLHGGPLGNGPRHFDRQAQNTVREFQNKMEQTEKYNWVGPILGWSDRHFKILVQFDTACRYVNQRDQPQKTALVRTLIDIESAQIVERAIIAREGDGGCSISSCSQLQQWIYPAGHEHDSAVEERPVSDCDMRHVWKDDLLNGCLADPYWRE